MKLSLRSQKINSSVDYSARCEHDERITNSSTVDTTLSHLNVYFKSEHFTPDLEQLWKNIRSDFDNKKAKNLIAPKARFLKRKQTKTTKDKNGLKKSVQVETSITREFIIQIGKDEDDISLERRKELYEKIMKFLAEKYKLTILKADLHADEKSPHLHFIATTYDFSTGVFSKEFGKPDSYAEMQNEALAYARTLMPELEDKVDKDCDFHDYIEPQVYRRNKELLDTAQEYCKKKKRLDTYDYKEHAEKIAELQERLRSDQLSKVELDNELVSLRSSLFKKEEENKELQNDVIAQREMILEQKTTISTQKVNLNDLKQNLSVLEPKANELDELYDITQKFRTETTIIAFIKTIWNKLLSLNKTVKEQASKIEHLESENKGLKERLLNSIAQIKAPTVQQLKDTMNELDISISEEEHKERMARFARQHPELDDILKQQEEEPEQSTSLYRQR